MSSAFATEVNIPELVTKADYEIIAEGFEKLDLKCNSFDCHFIASGWLLDRNGKRIAQIYCKDKSCDHTDASGNTYSISCESTHLKTSIPKKKTNYMIGINAKVCKQLVDKVLPTVSPLKPMSFQLRYDEERHNEVKKIEWKK